VLGVVVHNDVFHLEVVDVGCASAVDDDVVLLPHLEILAVRVGDVGGCCGVDGVGDGEIRFVVAEVVLEDGSSTPGSTCHYTVNVKEQKK